MKKISLIVNVETYLHNTPQKIKHDLHDMFNGLEDLFQEAIQTIQNSIVQDVFDLNRTKQVLWQHAYETINAMLQEEEVTDKFIDTAATGFRDLCVDLHDSVIPHVHIDGIDISEVHVTVDEVVTHGHSNGDVGEEVTLYITCEWEREESILSKLVSGGGGLVPKPKIWNDGINRELTVYRPQDTTFRMDEEQLHDWAPGHLRPFVQGVMVDIITRFLKYGMTHPDNMKSRSDVTIYHVVWQSLKSQIIILEEEIDTMDEHCYNQDVLEMYYCYEDYLKSDTKELSLLVDKIANYVTEFFFTASDLRDRVWRDLTKFKNAIVFRNKETITFRLLAK